MPVKELTCGRARRRGVALLLGAMAYGLIEAPMMSALPSIPAEQRTSSGLAGRPYVTEAITHCIAGWLRFFALIPCFD
jgi:hypothetical protein